METIKFKIITSVIILFALINTSLAQIKLQQVINITEINSCSYVKAKFGEYNKDELLEISLGFYKLKELSNYYNNMNFIEYNKDLYNRCSYFNRALRIHYIKHPDDILIK